MEQAFEIAESHERSEIHAISITDCFESGTRPGAAGCATAAVEATLAAMVAADLVVVGTHGRRGLTRLLLGSVAETLVRTSPCRVLVARSRSAEALA